MSVDAAELVIMFVTFLAGAKGDLLDTMSTDQYWQARHIPVTTEQLREDAQRSPDAGNVDRLLRDLASEDFQTRVKSRQRLASMGPGIIEKLKPAAHSRDPEVSETVTGLIGELSKQSHRRDVERLMAIRTLGERRDSGALALLEPMESESDVFVAAYARRAVAEIEGKPWALPDMHEAVASDAWLLPSDTAMVLQATQAGWEGVTVERLAQMAKAAAADRAPTAQDAADAALAQPETAATQPATAPAEVPPQMLITQRLIGLAERVGDFRIDGMTLGISKDFDGDAGWFVTILHGQYDPATVRTTVTEEVAAQGRIATRIDGVDAIALDEGYMLLPSPTEMVILYDDDSAGRMAHAQELVRALKAGKGELSPTSAVGKMLDTVRTGAVAWGASTGNDAMIKEPMFAAFPQMTLRATRDGQKLAFTIAGKGKNAEAIKATQDALTDAIKAELTDLQGDKWVPDSELGPAVALFRSMKVEMAGDHGALTGTVPADITRTFIQGMFLESLIDPDEDAGDAPGAQGAAP